METSINEDAINLVIFNTRKLIQLDKLDEAFLLLNKHFAPISNDLAKSILLNNSLLTILDNQIANSTITEENATVQRTRIKSNLLFIIERVPIELEVRQIVEGKQPLYKATNNEGLEKILGQVSNLVKINWLEKGIKASKSVCQVVRNDGQKGTGFVLKGGYLMTNFHVLPNAERVAAAKIIFDFEDDLLGNARTTSEYFLEPEGAKFSPLLEFDYAYVKIKDNPASPLSNWGFLELDTFSVPQIDEPVTIIQHPLGQTKQIAVTANQIINIVGPKLFYRTDTDEGSSGSPVFSNEWKVIALHHAGKKAEDGGLLVNPATGERRGANEGILIKNIAQQLGIE